MKVETSIRFVMFLGLFLGLFALSPTTATARSIPDTLYHRAESVPVMVVVKVLTKSPPRHDGRNNWHHDHVVEVERVLKGKVGDKVAIRAPSRDPRKTELEEGDTQPNLMVGHRYVLLLNTTAKAGRFVVPGAHSDFPATEEMVQALDLACHPEKWSWGPAAGGLQLGAMVEGTYWHNNKWYAEMTTALRNRTEKPIALEFGPKLVALSGTVTHADAEHPLRFRNLASAGKFTVPAGGIAVIDNAGGSSYAQQIALPGERDATEWKVNLQCILGTPDKESSRKLKSAPIRITRQGHAEDGDQAAAAEKPATEQLAGLIDRVLAGDLSADEVRVAVMWGGKQLRIDRPGSGLWNRSKIFAPTKRHILAILTACHEAEFTSMPARFGGIPRPPGGPAIGAPVEFRGNVSLTISGVTWSVNQLGGGEQSKELAALAERILGIVEADAAKGKGAANLADALSLIAAGKLPPDLLNLTVVRMPPKGAEAERWYLYVRNHGAELMTVAGGEAVRKRLDLDADELAGIAKQVSDSRFDTLPRNLHAAAYTDVKVSVFAFRTSVQARQNFARAKTDTHGDRQEHFNVLFRQLDALRARVDREGERTK